jgi:ADP-ribosylglycohydrolase
MPSPSPDAVAGSLLGLALGDALGSVVEARPAEDAQRYVEEYLRAGRAGERGFGEFPFGQYSDDTQLTRELLISLVEQGRLDPEDYAGRIAVLVRDDRLIRGGRATTASARRILAGVAWDRAGEPPPYAGNGAAMRSGPLGAIWPDDLEQVREAALQQARITHLDPRAAAGAVAIAGAAALAARRTPIDPILFLQELRELVQPIEGEVAARIGGIAELLALPLTEAARHLAQSGVEPGSLVRWLGISSLVTTSVCWSLYSFLRSPDDYWQTLCTAIEVGGDTDTVAGMAGSIAGARVGLAALPTALIGRLNDRGEWDGSALHALAIRCAERMAVRP